MIGRLQKSKVFRLTAAFLAINLLLDTLYATQAFALTAGPGSPEFASFEPVATTDMVNLFSGDFNYNLPVLEIPGPDGGGYALSLSYHSGSSSEEEASWVGYGWSLNPGAINRNTRGFPDDYSNTSVDQYNKSRINWSASVTNSAGLEIYSKDKSKEDAGKATAAKGKADSQSKSDSLLGGFNLSTSLRFNNNQGFARSYGFGLNAKGMVSLGMNLSAQGMTYSADVNVSSIFHRLKKKNSKKKSSDQTKTEEKTAKGIKFQNQTKPPSLRGGAAGIVNSMGSTHGLFTFSDAVRASSVISYRSVAFDWSIGLSVNATPLPIGIQAGADGNFNLQKPLDAAQYSADGFMNNTAGMSTRLGDYYVERNSPYQKRAFYLGIPFNNADNYAVSGEGLSGGFRYYPKETGHFFPNQVSNETPIYKTGFDLAVGGSLGIGVNFGVGTQQAKVDDWNNAGNTDDSHFSYNSPEGIFRFNNDMGGSVEYGTSGLHSAALSAPLLGAAKPSISKRSIYNQYDTAKLSNSTYITYHTAEDTDHFNKSSTQGTPISNKKAVTELAITNADGNQYVYGLPVYNRNETNLQFDVKPSEIPVDRYLVHKTIGLKTDSDKGYTVDTKKHNSVIGEIRQTPYATTYLLTQIVTNDYIDLNGNGPDIQDFGGWTQFHYQQVYGCSQDWYRWRTPYTGLQYQKNQLSDLHDDAGILTTGEKEVYYLNAIETKTHVAFFVTNKTTAAEWDKVLTDLNLQGMDRSLITGSQKERLDGLGAAKLTAQGDPAARGANVRGNTPTGEKGTQALRYLEKIVLLSKKRLNQPIKTTYFQYDNSMVRNLPNNVKGNYPDARTQSGESSGKLTLKKVWFEYEGVVNSRISPYEFTYAYKDSQAFADHVRAQYPVATAVNELYTEAAQNPDYSAHLLDPWGNLQPYGKERKQYLIPWVYQGPLPARGISGQEGWRSTLTNSGATAAYKEYDPAAWQLKQIKLPSGGEILVEYEQKDYAHVQNRRPMAMASLLEAKDSEAENGSYSANPAYLINTRDLGLDPASPTYAQDLEEQRQVLLSHFREQKVYFKFLYNMASVMGQASLDNCQSEYLTGYAEVDTVLVEKPQQIALNESHLKIILKGSKVGKRTQVPRQVCYDFYSTQRYGKNSSNCESDLEIAYDQQVHDRADDLLSPDQATRLQARLAVITPMMLDIQKQMGNADAYGIPSKEDVGTDMNASLSYLKLPMLKAKRGGGVRVKRLLIYDPGLETGDASLYGQEYFYQDTQEVNGKMRVISSGVATNEPGEAREESPLVSFMPSKKQQSWYNRITAGEDLDQAEGPLGESLLPGAEVGHSRVIVQNIHRGESGSGYTEHSFYTVKEYPFDYIYKGGKDSELAAGSFSVSHTNLKDNQNNPIPIIIPAGLFYYESSSVQVAQGYRFILNAMHGQIKQVATYVGDYTLNLYEAYDALAFARYKPVASQTYEYYEPGEKVKLMNPDGTYSMGVPGKEMDVVMERKRVADKAWNLGLEVDITLGAIPPLTPITVSAGLNVSMTDRSLSTHVTNKILRYPTILKRVTALQDGVESTTDNLAFNPHTGLAILTKTTDSFHKTKVRGDTLDGSVYNLQLPASWYYPEMGPKFKNSAHQNQLSAMTGSLVTYGKEGNPLRSGTENWEMKPPLSVLNASAQTFSKDWFIASENTPVGKDYGLDKVPTPILTKLNAIWRPKGSYVYRDDVRSANTGSNRIYNGGVLNQFELFSQWTSKNEALSPKWVLATEVIQYSPHGTALEEKNALNIYSAARYGYRNTVPVMVATNARYSATFFDSFEDVTAEGAITGLTAHSGQQARTINEVNVKLMEGLSVDANLKRIGGIVKLWVKPEATNDVTGLSLQVSGSNTRIPLQKVAQTGEWILYSGLVPPASLPKDEKNTFSISLVGGKGVTIDDIRFQPKEAQATCYVYDVKTLKLLTQFDDQHFGMYYQYNDEGKLVRKLIETERGMKTIQETQYNTPKAQREQP